MNYTEKYHLPQWVKEDRIMMEDFNAAMAGIEGGIAEAKGTADTAMTTASAAYSPEQKPYVTGTYYGTCEAMTFNLGFRPSFLIIYGALISYPAQVDTMAGYGIMTGGHVLTEVVTFTDTGFIAKPVEISTGYPKLVECRNYDYIAFR